MALSAPVSSIQLTLNSGSGRVTVHENDDVDVDMECRTWGTHPCTGTSINV